MARKFLVFSCLVFLISIVYFIYTRYQMHTENKNQQEVTAELEAPSVGHVSISRSSQPKTEDSNPEPTEEELAAFEAFLSNLEELEELEELDGTTETIQPEEVAETEVSETEGDDTGISPELEEMFIHYKEVFLNRSREVSLEIAPFMRRIVELDERTDELDNLMTEKSNRGEPHQELREEYRQLSEERNEVFVALEPLDERRAQVYEDWEEYLLANHGIDSTTFNETYNEALRSWLANQ